MTEAMTAKTVARNRGGRWKGVPGFEDRYAVSDGGDVVSLLGDRLRGPGEKMPCHPTGVRGWEYDTLRFRDGGRIRRFRVHRLVAELFLDPPGREGMVVHHVDGDRRNNAASNLEWVPKEDVPRLGAHLNPPDNRGEKSALAKLTEEDVRAIRRLLADGEPRSKVARDFGVTYQAIHLIGSGKRWAHVT